MIYRTIAQTGVKTSFIGLGTVKFGRNQKVKYPSTFSLPSDKQVIELLSRAYDLGINTLDTAPAYGLSEERIGRLLPYPRDKWTICTKVGENFENNQSSFDFSRDSIIESVHTSLKKLKTDYLDVILVHSDGNDIAIVEQHDLLETLSQLKEKGLVRAVGMSTKTREGSKLSAELFDLTMLTLNLGYKDEVSSIEKSAELGKGVFIKKAFDSGHITNETFISETFSLMAKTKGISSVIIGTINGKHLEDNTVKALQAMDTI